MKIFRQFSFVSLFLCVGFNAFADFSLSGNLAVTDPYGRVHQKEMPLAYSQQGDTHKFTFGQFQYKVSGQPEKYSIAVVLQDTNFVWVQEFHDKPIKTFEWTLGEHKIALYKEILEKPVKGDYILSIDDKDYFFNNRLAQVTFIFNEEGIEEIEVGGMVASLGLNKSKDKCPKSNNESNEDMDLESDEESTEDTESSEDEKSEECKPPQS